MVPQLPALILFLDARLLALNALLLIVIIYLCHFLFLALPQTFPSRCSESRQRNPVANRCYTYQYDFHFVFCCCWFSCCFST